MSNVNSAEGVTVPPEPTTTRLFEEHRELLMAVAYRVLGRVCDAEDVAQEAWRRLRSRAGASQQASPIPGDASDG